MCVVADLSIRLFFWTVGRLFVQEQTIIYRQSPGIHPSYVNEVSSCDSYCWTNAQRSELVKHPKIPPFPPLKYSLHSSCKSKWKNFLKSLRINFGEHIREAHLGKWNCSYVIVLCTLLVIEQYLEGERERTMVGHPIKKILQIGIDSSLQLFE